MTREFARTIAEDVSSEDSSYLAQLSEVVVVGVTDSRDVSFKGQVFVEDDTKVICGFCWSFRLV